MRQGEAVKEPEEVRTGAIKIHGEEGFEGMRKAGRLAAETLDFITPYIQPGVTTGELDKLCHDFIIDNGGIPAPLGYRGFPKSVCTSINHVVCHGIPGDRVLKDGDIMNIDVTPTVDGWHGDHSRMFFAGDVPIKARRLCDITYEAMWRGIKAVKPGATLGDIGHAIQSFVEAERCSVVRDFCGHGLGKVFHDAPNVLHYGEPHSGVVLKAGMFFTIEPMVNLGRYDVKILSDGWTAVTRDRSLSAQFEHSLAVTEDGYEVFTRSPKDFEKPPYAGLIPTDVFRSSRVAAAQPLCCGCIERSNGCPHLDTPAVAECSCGHSTRTVDLMVAGPKGMAEKPHHLGHRQRLRDRFLSGGAESMPDYEILEMLLFGRQTARRHQAACKGADRQVR